MSYDFTYISKVDKQLQKYAEKRLPENSNADISVSSVIYLSPAFLCI